MVKKEDSRSKFKNLKGKEIKLSILTKNNKNRMNNYRNFNLIKNRVLTQSKQYKISKNIKLI